MKDIGTLTDKDILEAVEVLGKGAGLKEALSNKAVDEKVKRALRSLLCIYFYQLIIMPPYMLFRSVFYFLDIRTVIFPLCSHLHSVILYLKMQAHYYTFQLLDLQPIH